jgi:2-dehydro-3-deoxyphosphogluconate aldolase / (4S)-4-hydroxy-2-oxoglutarate aldolase
VGVGSAVTKAWESDGDFGRVTDAARDFLEAVRVSRR